MTEAQLNKALKINGEKEQLIYLLGEVVDGTVVRFGKKADYGRVSISLDGDSERDIDNELVSEAVAFREKCVKLLNEKIAKLEKEFNEL